MIIGIATRSNLYSYAILLDDSVLIKGDNVFSSGPDFGKSPFTR